MSQVEQFVLPFLIVFASAAVFFVLWWILRRLVIAITRQVAERTVAETRRRDPPAGVAPGADSWACRRCHSVNRADAIVCYRCRGDRATVEELQGRM